MPRTRFTLRQLEIFAAVMREGRVRQAAGALHLSQAAVSQALAELADALDAVLFERHGRSIVPTATARQLERLAAAPVAALNDIAEQIGDPASAGPLAGDVRVAASSTITRYILPGALARLAGQHPRLSITVISGNSADVEAQITGAHADLGFIEGPCGHDGLVVSPWRTDTLQIIAPAGYAVDAIDPRRLDAHRWIARERGSGTRAVFEQHLALAGIAAPAAALVLDDSGAIVRAVAAGAGLACVSWLAAAQAQADARILVVDLPGLSMQRPLWRIQRESIANSAQLERFSTALDAALDDDANTFEPAKPAFSGR